MRVGWMMAGLILAGCSHGAKESERSATSTACNVGNDLVKPSLGRLYSDELGLDLQHRSRSAVLRVVRPGDVVTTDFRADRLTVQLDSQGRINGANCG